MKFLITEQQLESIANKFVLDTLNKMDFKLLKNKDFSFFPKGGNTSAEHGIEADWISRKGYSILVGQSLWNTVKNMFGLTDDQVRNIFLNAFTEKGIKKISEIVTIDTSEINRLIFGDQNY